MYLKLDSSFSNYKINFITYLRIQPVFLFCFFCHFFFLFFFPFFSLLVEIFLRETFQASAQPLQAGSQTKQFHFFALCPAISPTSPSSALFTSVLSFFFLFFFLVGQVGNEKSVSFLVPGQSGSNLFLFFSFFPHIHSAATFCLKATLSQEHSLRTLLSDERGEKWRGKDRERRRGGVRLVVIKAQYYKHRKKSNGADSWQLTAQSEDWKQNEAR